MMPQELATIRDAVALVRTGDTVLLPGQAATLTKVSDAPGQRADLQNIRVESMHIDATSHGRRGAEWSRHEPCLMPNTRVQQVVDWPLPIGTRCPYRPFLNT
jgi:hypothetical protein